MELKEVQDRSFELLCLLDDICKKEGVKYFLDSGTELGAVRDKNIIPWDDDIDIKVMLEDYPAFKSAMQKNLPQYVHLVEPSEFAPGFYDFICRIVDDRYLLRRETEEDLYYKNLQNHIGIDVFIVFGIPDNKIQQLCAIAQIRFIYGLGMGHRWRIDYSKYSTVEKIAIAMFSTLGKLFSTKSICNLFFKKIEKLNRKAYKTVWHTFFNPKRKMKKCWMEGVLEAELRGRQFPIPTGYDEELTLCYGNYMIPVCDKTLYIQHLDEADSYQKK